MAYTLNNIIDLISTFQSNHKQLKVGSFYFGRLPDSLSEQDIRYPTLLIEPLPSTIEEGIERFVFKCFILDLATHERENEKDSLSDTKLISNDLIAYFKNQYFNNNLSVEHTVTMTPLIGALSDLCNGWEFDLVFKQFNSYNNCQIPD